MFTQPTCISDGTCWLQAGFAECSKNRPILVTGPVVYKPVLLSVHTTDLYSGRDQLFISQYCWVFTHRLVLVTGPVVYKPVLLSVHTTDLYSGRDQLFINQYCWVFTHRLVLVTGPVVYKPVLLSVHTTDLYSWRDQLVTSQIAECSHNRPVLVTGPVGYKPVLLSVHTTDLYSGRDQLVTSQYCWVFTQPTCISDGTSWLQASIAECSHNRPIFVTGPVSSTALVTVKSSAAYVFTSSLSVSPQGKLEPNSTTRTKHIVRSPPVISAWTWKAIITETNSTIRTKQCSGAHFAKDFSILI